MPNNYVPINKSTTKKIPVQAKVVAAPSDAKLRSASTNDGTLNQEQKLWSALRLKGTFDENIRRFAKRDNSPSKFLSQQAKDAMNAIDEKKKIVALAGLDAVKALSKADKSPSKANTR